MKKNKTIANLVATAAMAVAAIVPSFAQSNLGAACGCPPVASRPTVDLGTAAFTNTSTGELLANTTLTCDKTYILSKKIYVPDGKSITIKAGTVVRGNTSATPGDATALIVARGGKIYATGTQDCPIVFTAAADPLDGTFPVGNRGQWGGVVLLGKATNNLTTANVFSAGGVNGVGFIEGFLADSVRNRYGAGDAAFPVADNNDNSGIMSYVSIRHAGATVGPNNELNGLTCGSVGKGTTLDHIEVISNDDDGIEFFGGNVDLKYATVMFCLDDAFDWDQGYTGKAQFLLLVQNSVGDNGYEMDADDEKTNALPRSHPFFYNATLIGNGGDAGLEAKEFTEGEIYNSVIANFGNGLNMIKAPGTRAGGQEVYANWIAGSFKVNNCTFVGTTNPLAIDGGIANVLPSDQTKFTNDGNLSAATVPGLDFAFVINNTTNVVTDKYNAVPTPSLSTTLAPPVDGFFTPASYRGAFEAGQKSWMANWSLASLLGATTGVVPCPTDMDIDGDTDVDDFIIWVNEFGTSCN